MSGSQRRVHRPQTLPALLLAAAAEAGSRPAVYSGESWHSFRDLAEQAGRFAAGLGRQGIAPGDRVAVAAKNRREFIVATYGIAMAGAILVPVNIQLTADEASFVVGHSGARALVYGAESAAQAAGLEACRELRLGIGLPGWEAQGGGACARAGGLPTVAWEELLAEPAISGVGVRPGDAVAIQYTSGTTSRPKGVVHSHRSLISAFVARARHMGYDAEDVMLIATPLFHLNAQGVVIMALWRRFRVVLWERFSASQFWPEVRRHGITSLNGMETISRILLARPPEPAERGTSLRSVVGVMPAERMREFDSRFGAALVPVYGLTEDPMPVLGPRRGIPRSWPDSTLAMSGRPTAPRRHQIRIVGEDGGDLGPGLVGEIVKRSPATMLGYFRDADGTAAVLTDGWLRTGDLGFLDTAGYLYYVGRKKDAVRSADRMIATVEVENAIATHPSVARAAVIGRPDPVRGEELQACVVPEPGAMADEALFAALRAWCGERLAAYKVPRFWEAFAELPLTATGKVRKDELRRRAAASDRAWDAAPRMAEGQR